ncbi:MAG: hypothetical protein H6Q43_2833 [Deltaproteobacteria bacterium]|nr:hypothetical protein [Deltaproteobacteria bacterium]MBP1719395.1 hypothetical protein [Deltaproteobacteria bacterium]
MLPRGEDVGMAFQLIIERKQPDEKDGKAGIIFAKNYFDAETHTNTYTHTAFMTWQETLKVVISGLNFLRPEQRDQLLFSLEILNRNRPENWQEMIRDYFRLTLRICSPNSFLTERLQKAQEAFERSLVVDEVGCEIFREVLEEES